MGMKRDREDDTSQGYEDSDGKCEEILQSRKLKKTHRDQIIGFCDNCERLCAVKPDEEFPQFNYCTDCEIEMLANIVSITEIE